METNETPEKLYLSNNIYSTYLYQVPDPDDETSVEYIRKDAFMDKACEFLSNEANIPLWEGCNDTFGCDTSKLVDNFIKYMKGE